MKQQKKPPNQRLYDHYEIVRSGDPHLLFQIGSLGGQSCQRTSGDPAKTKCLLAYPSDGKNQVIYAKEPNKSIEARAILRFFYVCDPKEQPIGPALYLEPFYPKKTDPILRRALTYFAIECTLTLGVPLLRHKTENNQLAAFPYNLATINGPAPFEYFDGTALKIKSNDPPEKEIKTKCMIPKTVIHQIFNPKNPSNIHL